MAAITFNSTDLSTYGLTMTRNDALQAIQDIQTSQLSDRSFASPPLRQPHSVLLSFALTGASLATNLTNLDNIKRILLLPATDCQLILSVMPARYFLAQCVSVNPKIESKELFTGEITFTCADPYGYNTTPTSNTTNINADPKTLNETVGGSAYALPVWTLTAGDILAAVTIKLENLTTDEELCWTGSLAVTDTLVIDSYHWTVKKNGTDSMATVTGEFPRLSPGIVNSIKVTAFGTNGTLNIGYRDTFA
jgi:phage-related protein